MVVGDVAVELVADSLRAPVSEPRLAARRIGATASRRLGGEGGSDLGSTGGVASSRSFACCNCCWHSDHCVLAMFAGLTPLIASALTVRAIATLKLFLNLLLNRGKMGVVVGTNLDLWSLMIFCASRCQVERWPGAAR